ncbi:MAG: leucine-rich repeat domain-containing protein [Alphaproteobacteria bacterium]|nr:leucine-rich repeat domain-containing protein [Alphaproteobacteria bacterium]
MNKSLLVASFAVLTASVFGTPLERGNSSNNPLLREIKQEHPNIENTEMQNPQENSQSNEINGNNLISSMLKILSENDIFKSEIRDKDAEIQKLTQEKDAKIQELRDKLSFMQQRLIKANNDVFNKLYEKSSHKRSRSVGEEEIQRELNSNKLRNVISQNNETISEYRKRQKSLESENQKLKILLKDTATELKEIQNLQAESENTHQKEKEALKFENQRLVKTNQEKEKRIADFQNQENNLKQKLDEVNQKLEKQKTKKLKGFQGEVLNTIQNLEIDVSKYEAFPRLKKLVIKSDEVSDILRNKPDLSKLTILDIYNCDEKPLQITELSELLHLARNIEGLDLSSCNLTFLPEGVGNLKNLRKLNLSYNNLTSLPKGIGNLTKLENLYLRKNQLTELPAEIYALPKLKELDIRNNPLEKLSREKFVSSNIKIHQ